MNLRKYIANQPSAKSTPKIITMASVPRGCSTPAGSSGSGVVCSFDIDIVPLTTVASAAGRYVGCILAQLVAD